MKSGKFKFPIVFTSLGVVYLLISLLFSACSQSAKEGQGKNSPKDMADSILSQSGVKGGFIVHVNCGDGVLTEALKKNDSFIVHGLDPNPDNVTKARDYISSKGEYGRISVDRLADNKLPYTNNMVNLIVADGLIDIPMDEVMRCACA